MTEEQKYELIGRYLNGELEGEELKTFTHRLASDLSFAEEVDLQRAADNVIITARLAELKDRIGKDLDKLEQKRSRSKNRFRAVIITALVTLIAVIALYIPETNNEEVNPENSSHSSTTSVEQESKNRNQEDGNKTITPEVSRKAEGPAMKETDKEGRAQDTAAAPYAGAYPSAVPATDSAEKEKPDLAGKPLPSLQKKETHKPEKTHSCLNIFITADVIAQGSCPENSNGSLEIAETGIRGGRPPYKFSLNKGENESKNVFNNLKAGTYNIRITDADGCYKDLLATVPLKDCSPKRQFSFNPGRESLIIPLSEEGEGVIKIMGRRGVVEYSAPVNREFEWRGINNNGSDLPSGAYYYRIEYLSGKSEQGYITIIR